jgi:alpha-amylase
MIHTSTQNNIMRKLLLSPLWLLLYIQSASAQTPANISVWPRGITYEIFVQSFADSDGDGKGDIKGMTAKLDYLKELGVGGIWLMPVNPSPSYHKYDVTDYYGIHPDYGTLDDFKKFIEEAHKRNIKVIMDMVLNHSGSQHPWFLDAKTNVNSPYRDYYVWTHKDDPQTQAPGKIIAGDSGNRNRWNRVEGSDYLYYSYFGSNMPDLNFDNPKLRDEVFKIGKFWLNDIKVDGFRLDAARHIFPDDRPRDNHRWWVYFRNEMQKVNKDVFLVGEVWAPAEIVGPYMQGLPALFNFDMGGVITKAVNTGQGDSITINHKKIIDFYKSINPDYVDATFLTNHDQTRIMSAVNNDIDKAKMAASILLTLPGSPYIYYGEEIGMQGKKPDQYIREPFSWDEKAKDKSRATWIVPRYSADSSVVPEAQQVKDKNSIYNHYKTLMQLRNTSKALTYGEMEPVILPNKEICAFVRSTNEEALLVLHNLSKTEVSFSLPANLREYNKITFNSKEAVVKNSTVSLPSCSTVILKK